MEKQKRKRLSAEEARRKMIDAAEKIIARDGLQGLTARRVAADCGVAVGTTYNLFESLDALVGEVNARTLGVLLSAVTGQELATLKPEERLNAFAERYIDFVQQNEARWLALFEVELTPQEETPQNQALVDRLFEALEAPIRDAVPALPEEALRRSARGLWAAVHGLLILSAGRRLSVIRLASVRPTVTHMIACHLRGLESLYGAPS